MAAVAATALLVGCVGRGRPVQATSDGVASSATPALAASPTPTDRPPVVMFLGDSYATGGGGIRTHRTYATETARLLGWQVIVAGHSGTGLVNGGRPGKDFAVLFEEQLAWRPAPDMLIVSGGHNDWRREPPKVGAAARSLLVRVSSVWPHTQVVVVGPLWGGDPRPEVRAVRDAIEAAATTFGVPFIDPLAERWITGDRRKETGNATRYVLPDGIHPTREGHRYLAARLAAELSELGLAEPRLGEVHQGP